VELIAQAKEAALELRAESWSESEAARTARNQGADVIDQLIHTLSEAERQED
jgi:hypothetical protein